MGEAQTESEAAATRLDVANAKAGIHQGTVSGSDLFAAAGAGALRSAPRSGGLLGPGRRGSWAARAQTALRLQSQVGNRAVARLVSPQRVLARDTELKPDGPWWQQRVDWVRAAIGRGDFVNYTGASETSGAYWVINPLNLDDQAKIMTFLDAASLDALLDYDDKAIDAGVPNAAHIAEVARKARALRTAPARDPLNVVVPGTWVDDFKEVRYDIDYRIDDGGSPSEWIQVWYKDGTHIDLNWYDFEDATLSTDDMKSALQSRFLGAGGRVFPGRKPTSTGRPGYTPRFALTRQLCPRLWAIHKEVEEIGAESTIQLMQLSLTAVMIVLTMPAMPVGPAPETAVTPRVTRRVVARSNRISVGQVAQMEARFRAEIRSTRDTLVKIPGSTKEAQGGVGPVLSGCLDKRSGEISYAVNQGKVPEQLHPILKARYEEYLQGSAGMTPPKAGVPGAHSEIGALNKALWARDPGGKMTAIPEGEFTMHNASLYRNRPEGVPPMCTNCSGIVPPQVKFLE